MRIHLPSLSLSSHSCLSEVLRTINMPQHRVCISVQDSLDVIVRFSPHESSGIAINSVEGHSEKDEEQSTVEGDVIESLESCHPIGGEYVALSLPAQLYWRARVKEQKRARQQKVTRLNQWRGYHCPSCRQSKQGPEHQTRMSWTQSVLPYA